MTRKESFREWESRTTHNMHVLIAVYAVVVVNALVTALALNGLLFGWGES